MAQKRGTITSQEQARSNNEAEDVTQYMKHDAQNVSYDVAKGVAQYTA